MYKHETVLQDELVDALNLKPGDLAVDCTLGGGGHTERLIRAVYTEDSPGHIVAIDCDYLSIQNAKEKFAYSQALTLCHARFSSLRFIVRGLGREGEVAGICADLGVSSMHIDEGERGFSFRKDGPLDMRMDRSIGQKSAADLVNELSQQELEDIFRNYGEEPKARQIAKAIVEQRAGKPFTNTIELADLVAKFWPKHGPSQSRKHPATRVFQALRIAVNGELEELRTLISDGFEMLKPGGRLAIISFHSLEDRIIKQEFQALAGKTEKEDSFLTRHLPVAPQKDRARGVIIKPFPVTPADNEMEQNPRARSAKLRVIEKL